MSQSHCLPSTLLPREQSLHYMYQCLQSNLYTSAWRTTLLRQWGLCARMCLWWWLCAETAGLCAYPTVWMCGQWWPQISCKWQFRMTPHQVTYRLDFQILRSTFWKFKYYCQKKWRTWTWRSKQYDDSLSFYSSMKSGTPITAVRNVNVRDIMAREGLIAMTKMSVMEMLSAFKMRKAIITASQQVL